MQTQKTTVRQTTTSTRGKKYTRYVVVYHDLKTGERKRKTFNDKTTAERCATQYDRDRKVHEDQQTILHKRIGESAKQLDADTLRDAVDALHILNGRGSLRDAARSFIREYEQRERDIPTVSELVDTYMQESEADNLRHRTIKDLRHRLGRLVKIYGNTRVDQIDGPDIRHTLQHMKTQNEKAYSATTRKHFHMAWQALFNYAIERGYIEANPVSSKTRLRRRSMKSGHRPDPEVWTPTEAANILKSAREHCPGMVAPLALGMFAGIRTAEIRRLEWEKHIDLVRGIVKIGTDIAKKRSVRNVTISDNLKKWLALDPTQSNMVAKQSDHQWRSRIAEIVKHADGINAWKQNAMRHSFGTYHLEHHGKPQKTALEMGHVDGGGVLFEHYRQLTDKATAEAYWKIEPGK